MKLYEIPPEMDRILEDGTVDGETGEWKFDQQAFDALEMDFNPRMEYLLLQGKNYQSAAEAIKAEIDALTIRYKQLLKKAERCFDYAAFCLRGDTFETPRVKVSYSKAVSTDVQKPFIDWAIENNRADLLTESKPTANKTAIKKALQGGEEIPFAKLVTGKMKVE